MRYEFEDFTFDTDRRELRRRDRPIAVQPQVFDVLAYLIANRDRVVTKDALFDAVWSGRIVSESTFSSRINAARAALDDSGEDQRLIRTVSRKGFRFVGAAREAASMAMSRPERSPAGDGTALPPQRQAGAEAGPRGAETAASLALPDRPSIAVLPFQNLSGDPEQEYFADGMVEDIVTGLARIKWLFVIARNSSFTYKNKAVDVRQVGRELGVRYVLEGAVRKAASRVRITAQLVDAETGAHLWAEKYDGALEEVFELQDQITDRVVGIVEPSVQRSEIERARRKRPENLLAYDYYLRALPYVALHMPDDVRKALGPLREALKLDPGYAPAHAHLAWCHELLFARNGFDESERTAALAHARAALAGDTDDAVALAVAGFLTYLLSEQQEAGFSALERALALNASCATAHFLAAIANAMSGHSQQATSLAARALRLSPFDPLAFEAHLALGIAAVSEARYADAASSFAKCGQVRTNFSTAYFNQAIALALCGRLDEARPLVARGFELEPGFRNRLYFVHSWQDSLRARFLAGARLLGLPE